MICPESGCNWHSICLLGSPQTGPNGWKRLSPSVSQGPKEKDGDGWQWATLGQRLRSWKARRQNQAYSNSGWMMVALDAHPCRMSLCPKNWPKHMCWAPSGQSSWSHTDAPAEIPRVCLTYALSTGLHYGNNDGDDSDKRHHIYWINTIHFTSCDVAGWVIYAYFGEEKVSKLRNFKVQIIEIIPHPMLFTTPSFYPKISQEKLNMNKEGWPLRNV